MCFTKVCATGVCIVTVKYEHGYSKKTHTHVKIGGAMHSLYRQTMKSWKCPGMLFCLSLAASGEWFLENTRATCHRE